MTASPLSLIGDEAVARALRLQSHQRRQPGLTEADLVPFSKMAPGIAEMYEGQARAAISAHLAALKEAGWILLPVEPTEAMRRAVPDCGERCMMTDDFIHDAYRAMCEAAPPTQNGPERSEGEFEWVPSFLGDPAPPTPAAILGAETLRKLPTPPENLPAPPAQNGDEVKGNG